MRGSDRYLDGLFGKVVDEIAVIEVQEVEQIKIEKGLEVVDEVQDEA